MPATGADSSPPVAEITTMLASRSRPTLTNEFHSACSSAENRTAAARASGISEERGVTGDR